MLTHRKDAINASFQNRAFSLGDILLTPPSSATPYTTLRAVFSENAADPGKAAPKYDSFDLWDQVTQNKGAVSPAEARAFVDGCLRSRFANEKRISDPRAKAGMGGLDFETLVTLYEKIAEEDVPQRSIYLRELNKALDQGEAFYEKLIAPVRQFFSRNNIPVLEQKWQDAKRAGRVDKSEGTFADTLATLLSHPPVLSKNEYIRRVGMLQFICDAYSESIGEGSVRVGLFQGQPGLKGFHMGKESPQGEVIGINLIEMHDFRSALNILMHERQHASQDRLAEALAKGRIKPGDDNYIAARLFGANRANHGYLSPDMPSGPTGYLFQPMEIDAHNAGNTAEYHATRTYGRPPKPHLGTGMQLAA
jgi:hypothetical protein